MLCSSPLGGCPGGQQREASRRSSRRALHALHERGARRRTATPAGATLSVASGHERVKAVTMSVAAG